MKRPLLLPLMPLYKAGVAARNLAFNRTMDETR